MTFFVVITIAIIQGITEFLPVSSSGHLVLFYQIFNIKNNTIFLSILLHVATLFSILIYYRKDVWTLIKHPFCKTNIMILSTTIPTIIFVLIFKQTITSSFNGQFLIFGFLTTAVLLGVADYMTERYYNLSITNTFNTKSTHNKTNNNNLHTNQHDATNSKIISNFNNDLTKQPANIKNIILNDTTEPARKNITLNQKSNQISNQFDITNIRINLLQAVIIGLAQGVACFPAISRSGTTISAGLMLGINKEEVTKYSFLISIPIIIASMCYELLDYKSIVTDTSIIFLIIAVAVAFLVGWLAIKIMVKLVSKNNLSYFSYYLIALSFLILFLKVLGVV